MKIFISTILFLLSIHAFATNYYVSNAGNDSNSGVTEQLPWKSLSKVNSTIFKPGDAILFRRGDTFLGSLTTRSSGTAGATITYSSYGTGALPVISGFQTISNWVSVGNGVYSAATTAPNTTNIVTVNGVNTPKGRYPNSGYLNFESFSGLTSITDNQLAATPNWTGAEIVIRSRSFVSEISTITNHSGSTLSFNAITQTPTAGFGYFIQNDIKALDLLGEWSIKNGTIYMYFGSNNPASYVVNIGITDNVFTVNTNSYITIDGLTLQGANKKDIVIYSGSNITIKNCNIYFSGVHGIYNSGSTFLLISNCIINSCNGSSIVSDASNTIIQNNTISDIAVFEGMLSIWQTNGIYCSGDSCIIEYNKISNIGYNGIQFLGNNTIIQNNVIDKFCSLLIDGGGIYTGNYTYTGRNIKNNIIINGLCDLNGTTLKEKANVGIYLDERSENINIEGNTVANIEGYGIFLHCARNISVTNNTVYNCSGTQLLFSHNTTSPNQSGISVNGNTFVAKESSQLTLRQYSTFNDYLFGSANNNVFARPIDDTNTISIEEYITYNSLSARHDLAWWKTFSGYDANSVKSPIAVKDTSNIDFYYNPTNTVKTITLTQPMMDLRSVTKSTSLSLQPYTSTVLLANPSTTSKTLGNTDVYGSLITMSDRRAIPVTFTESGSIGSISLYHNGGTGNILIGVYSDLAGVPSALLGVTNATAVNVNEGWQTIALPNPVNVSSGQTVWLAWVFQNSATVRYTAGTPGRAVSPSTWSDGMPVSFGAATFANYMYSIYCTYTTGAIPTLSVSPASISLNFGSGSNGTFNITSNTNWNIADDASWLDFSPTTGANNGTITVTANSSNTGTSPRTGTITISATGVASKTLTVTQANQPIVFTTNTSSISLGATSGSNGIFNITSNTTWNITDDSNWLDISPTTGANNGTITVTANSSNTGTSPRTGTITISATGVASKTLTVTQANQPTVTNTLGNTTVFSSTTAMADRRAVPVTFSESGSISSITLYHNGGTGSVLLGVYSDLAGFPSTLLGVTAATLVNSAEGWQTVSLTSPVSVISGQTVWLSWVFQYSTMVRYTSGNPGRVGSPSTWASGMPASFGSSSWGNYNYSIYCTYTTGVVPALSVSPLSISMDYGSGTSATFNITSNTTWNIADDASWLDISPTTGANNGTITVTANSSNTGASPRTGTITISATGVASNTLTVTQANQPTVTKTLGNTTVFSSTTAMADRRAVPVTFSESGSMSSITLYHNGGTGSVLLGVYSDLAGFPSTLLGVTAATLVNSAEGWQTVSLTSPVSVISGQTVWLSWVFQYSTVVRYTSGNPGRVGSPSTWASGMPASFGSSSWGNYNYSIYCTYTTGVVNQLKSSDIILGIDSLFHKNTEMLIYPNPTQGSTTVELNNSEKRKLNLIFYTIQGILVKKVQIEQGTNQLQINLGDFLNGMYLVELKDAKTGLLLKTSRIVKSN